MKDAVEQKWRIVALKKQRKTGKFLLSLGTGDNKSNCAQHTLSREQLNRLQEKLLGRKTNCLKKLIGHSIPKHSQDSGADLKKFIA